MIRKPAEGWGRESAAVATVRTAAARGKDVVVTGGRAVRGLGLCAVGGLWTFAGLAAGLSGSLPTLIGAGGLGLLTIAVGLRIMRGPRALDGATPARPTAGPRFVPAAAGPVTALAYSRGKLLAHAGFGLFAVLFAVWGVGHLGGPLRIIMTVLIPVFALMSLGAARRAFGDLTALRWDSRGLSVRTLFSQRELAWSQVASIDIQRVNTYAFYGLLKVATQRSLMVRLARGGLFGGRVGVSSALLDLEGRTLEGLVIELAAAQAGRGVPPPPIASAAPPGASQPARPLDPASPRTAAPGATAPAAAASVNQPPGFETGSARAFGRRGV
ncbi:hypothetical protein [Phenylobacterium sp.]|jgi:hypothetical protein|uniref:hypothetical protein n=1 Tax=Phenylobacterium sp. TaxID=1871053 RepID=UPI002F40FC51